MSLQQFLIILWAHRKLGLLTLLGTVCTTLAVSLIMPAQYTGSTSVVVDVKSADPMANLGLSAMSMPSYMATQVDIINSDRVAQRVVKLLKLDEIQTVKDDWQEATEGKLPIAVWLGELLQKKLDVKPSRESNVIAINFKGADPRFAAGVANAFAQAFIETTIELKVEPARQYVAWFELQSKALRERLEQAKAKLSAYQMQKGIVATDDRLNFENQKLIELQSLLVATESQSADSSSKQKSGGADTLQDVMQSPVVGALRADIARLEGKLQDARGNLGKNHPQIQRMESELKELRQQEHLEVQKISTAIGTSSRVSKSKEGELRAAIEAHKKRILELKGGRDEVSVLQQEVDSVQRSYELLSQRQSQVALESNSTQTNVSVLTPATPPIKQSSPKVLLNVLVSIFLGTLLGVGAALMLELADRRVRSADDLAQAFDIPVLAELSPPSERARGFFARIFRPRRHAVA